MSPPSEVVRCIMKQTTSKPRKKSCVWKCNDFEQSMFVYVFFCQPHPTKMFKTWKEGYESNIDCKIEERLLMRFNTELIFKMYIDL